MSFRTKYIKIKQKISFIDLSIQIQAVENMAKERNITLKNHKDYMTLNKYVI